jgi:uncharacterized repeat protein (TIGR03806 family)
MSRRLPLQSALVASSILLSAGVALALSCFGEPEAVEGGVRLERAFPRLRFERPVQLLGAGDGSGRVFVVEQAGVVRVFPNEADPERSEVFLDISERVSRRGNEEGLIGFAFHPDFARNGEVYAHYSLAGDEATGILSRFRLDGEDSSRVDPDSEEVLLRQSQPWRNHNGGMIAFGPDGYLYLSLGDGGAANDPQGNGQDLSTWLGSILRIDVDRAEEGRPYAVPADNPFVDGPEGARPEIWAFGLRNVWRFSFDRETGDLWAGDVGQNKVEEIDLIVRGGNYGWRRFEADRVFDDGTELALEPAIPPVSSYPRSEGISVTGGVVYRGQRFPSLQGQYLYGDYVSGNLWRVVHAGNGGFVTELAARTGRSIASFGEDDEGELFVCSFDGGIHRVVPAEDEADPFADWPERLSETGLFAWDEEARRARPTEALTAYEVNAPFWSDGAEKGRWFALPEGEAFGYAEEGAWEVPVGATLVKHFRARHGRGMRDLETRLTRRTEDGWEAATYVWRGSDAVLAPEGRQFELWGDDGVRSWHAPSASECASCHVEATGFPLGLRTAQLNRERGDGENQLLALAEAGALMLPRDFDPGAAPRLVDPADELEPLEDRARAWLEVNCAMCHQPAGPGNAAIDLRRTTALDAAGLVGMAPAQGPLDGEDALLVAPGDAARSLLVHRVRTLGDGRMPPIGSNVVDEEGAALLEAWIEELGAD